MDDRRDELSNQIGEILANNHGNSVFGESFEHETAKQQLKALFAKELDAARIDELKQHGDQWRVWLDDTEMVKLKDVVNWYDVRIAELTAALVEGEQ